MSWYPCACCTYCENCQRGFAPRQWQVDISGLAADTCPECAQLNATYVLEPSAACQWEYVLPSAICGVTRVRLTVGGYLPIPPTWAIVLELRDAAGNILMFVQKTYTARPDCMAMNAESFGPLNLQWGVTACNVAGSEVRLTALRPCDP